MMHNISGSCKYTELLLLFIWISSAAVAASRSNFVPDYRHEASPMGTTEKVSLQTPTAAASDQMMVTVKVARSNNIPRHLTTIDTLGSRPPTCRNKCSSCSPCEAIQVPTKAARTHVQYSNYEPEGWKCKCRDRVFNPWLSQLVISFKSIISMPIAAPILLLTSSKIQVSMNSRDVQAHHLKHLGGFDRIGSSHPMLLRPCL